MELPQEYRLIFTCASAITYILFGGMMGYIVRMIVELLEYKKSEEKTDDPE